MNKVNKALIITGFLKTVNEIEPKYKNFEAVNSFHDYIYLADGDNKSNNSLNFYRGAEVKTGIFFNNNITDIKTILSNFRAGYNFKYGALYYFQHIFHILSNFCDMSFCLDLDIFSQQLQMQQNTNSRRNIYINIFKKIDSILQKEQIKTILFSLHNKKNQVLDIENKPVFYRNLNIIKYISNRYKDINIFIGGTMITSKKYQEIFNKIKNVTFVFGRDLKDFDILKHEDQHLGYQYYGEKDINVSKINYLHDLTFNHKTIKSLYNFDIDKSDLFIKHMNFQLSQDTCIYGKCAFCNSSGSKIFKKTSDYYLRIKKNIDDLKFFNIEYNSTMILDGSFTSDQRILDLFENANLKFNIAAGVRLSELTLEKVKQLNRIGVKIANIGLETYDNEHLKYIKKNLTTDIIDCGIQMLHDNNIFLNCNFIVGMPNAPKNELDNILKLITKFGYPILNSVKVSVFTMMGNSDFVRNPKKYNLNILNIDDVILYNTKNSNTFKWYKENIKTVYNFSSKYSKYCMETENDLLQLILYLYKIYKTKQIVWGKYKEIIDSIHDK